MSKVFRTVTVIAIAAGLGLILGTAGALEHNSVSVMQALLQMAGGIALSMGGVAVLNS